MKRKTIGKKIATLATVSALTVGCLPMNVFAYGGEVTVDNGTFRTETDNNEDYKTWKETVWDKPYHDYICVFIRNAPCDEYVFDSDRAYEWNCRNYGNYPCSTIYIIYNSCIVKASKEGLTIRSTGDRLKENGLF